MGIFYDILKAIGNGRLYTHVIYKANLGGNTVNRYLKPILKSDLVIEDGNYFKLSDKGLLARDHGDQFVKLCNLERPAEGELYGYNKRKKTG